MVMVIGFSISPNMGVLTAWNPMLKWQRLNAKSNGNALKTSGIVDVCYQKGLHRMNMRMSVYDKFEEFAIQEIRKRTEISPFPMQVLDVAVLPKPEFDLPIFCANFFSTINMNIVVLDLNPLYDVKYHEKYKEKYYRRLMPLALKYVEILPWGGKITSESLKFFSPIVIWAKFTSIDNKQDVLYSAFTDYLTAWLDLMDAAVPETKTDDILNNKEAQHRYLLWRATKDPGHPILTRLLGNSLSEELISDFLFNGALTLGCKRFLDFFPEYRCADGTVNKKRSMAGKLFSERPWNKDGNFLDIS